MDNKNGDNMVVFDGDMFNCLICDYITPNKQHFKRHINSKKHNDKNNGDKLEQLFDFNCDICKYNTNNETHYKRHMLSNKHKKQLAISQGNVIIENKCVCGNTYKYTSGLTKHKKKCSIYNQQQKSKNNTDIISLIPKLEDVDVNKLFDTVMNLASKNSDLTSQIKKQFDCMSEKFDQVIELAKQPKIINNNPVFNTLNYLNTHCQDVISLTEFMKQITYSFADIEKMTEIGWEQSVIQKLMEILKFVEQNKRPIHCTDGKRKQFVYKKDDGWFKEQAEKLFKIMTNIVINTQTKTALNWKKINEEKIKQNDDTHDKSMLMNIEIGSLTNDKKGPPMKKRMINKVAEMCKFDKSIAKKEISNTAN